jgi:hypothetical protein
VIDFCHDQAIEDRISRGFLSCYFWGKSKRAYILGDGQAFGKDDGRRRPVKQRAKSDKDGMA